MKTLPGRSLLLSLSLLSSLALTSQAFAAPIPPVGDLFIDFRTDAWAGADGQTSFAVDGVTATAAPAGRTLWQDSQDGIGVRGGANQDEVDPREQLLVDFGAGGKTLTGVWVTDLFDAPDGTWIAGEVGAVQLTLTDGSGQTHVFFGNLSEQTNGEQFISFGPDGIQVEGAIFVALTNGSDFSVGGFEGYEGGGGGGTNPVPEPTTLALFGLGLVGAGLAQRMRSRA